MRISRSAILLILGILTIFFLGSSYALWFNDDLVPPSIRDGEFATPLAAATAGINLNRTDAVRLTVKETGIVAVEAKDIENAGFSVKELSSLTFSLTRNDRQVPFLVIGEGDAATLYFYGQATANSREPFAVYMLRPGRGAAIPERDASPRGLTSNIGQQRFRWEEDRLFVGHAGGDDVWMGELLMAPHKWILTLDDIQVSAAPAELTIHLFSNRDGPDDADHQVEIQINDQAVAEHSWDGVKHEIVTIPLEKGILTGEVNSVGVVLQAKNNTSAETVYVNAMELLYQGPITAKYGQTTFSSDAENIAVNGAEDGLIIFDITDRDAPVYLSNTHTEGSEIHFSGSDGKADYIATEPSNSVRVTVESAPAWSNSMRDSNWGADYIAIVADVNGFNEALDPLLQHRKDQGMRVLSVPLEQIYDEFGAGHKSPVAIKTFLAYAAAHWTPPAPSYVLLVGDGTYDAKDQVSGKNRNRLPTPLIHTSVGGFVASDSWYGRYTGGLSPMAVGRFPVQNAPQLRVLVSKTLAFEQQSLSQEIDWRKRALLVADTEPIFDDQTLELSSDLEENGYRIYRLRMSENERVHYPIISAINQGVGLVNYFGHGGSSTWGDEVVFENSDVRSLQNSTKLPILTSFTTLNGAFADPNSDTLAETLLRANNGGVVAAVALSGKANSEQMLSLSEEFYGLLLQQDDHSLGDILTELSEKHASDPTWTELLAPINLLGDPALRFYTP
ncbi:MAG: C25 family cysteine peptidase [Candidatus Promineifilaceae bacterium]|nr:C25 family cysteine peptidase [Candidatus Promineifilaceae bacterium]